MAIDHESPFKELRLKNRRVMGGGGPDPEPEEEEAATAAYAEQWPRWLQPLLSARFFAHCKTHSDSHRNGECNMFCLDCSSAAAKKQSFSPPTPPTMPAKRRKGIPHRAPFGSLIVEY